MVDFKVLWAGCGCLHVYNFGFRKNAGDDADSIRNLDFNRRFIVCTPDHLR